MTRPLYLLAPRVSREEVPGLRRLFPGRQVFVCDATSHTPGQPIPGDVVVVGDDAQTAEQDASGKMQRYADMDALMASRRDVRGGEATAVPAPDGARAETAAAPAASTSAAGGGEALAATPPPPPPPDFEKMGRPELIQYAAAKHPGQGRWVTLGAPAIREKLRELEAGD